MLPAPVKWVSVPGLGSAGRRSRRRCPAACGDRDVSVGGSPSSRLREAPLGEAATTWDHNGTRLQVPVAPRSSHGRVQSRSPPSLGPRSDTSLSARHLRFAGAFL